MIALVIIYIAVSCTSGLHAQVDDIKVAFMADIHFADVYPDLDAGRF